MLGKKQWKTLGRRIGTLLLSAAMMASGFPVTAKNTTESPKTATSRIGAEYKGASGQFTPQPTDSTVQYVLIYQGKNTVYAEVNKSKYHKYYVVENNKSTTAYCIQRGVSLDSNLSYTGTAEDSNEYFNQLPQGVRGGIQLAALYGYRDDAALPISGINEDDWRFATQCIIWEYQQQLRTGTGVNDLKDNPGTVYYGATPKSIVIPGNLYYGSIQGTSAELIYKWMLKKMEMHSTPPSFCDDTEHIMHWDADREEYSITLEDSNAIDIDLIVTDNSAVSVTRTGSRYTFRSKTPIAGGTTVTLQKNTGAHSAALIWEKKQYQSLMTGANDTATFELHLCTTDDGALKLQKQSEDGKVSGVSFLIQGNQLEQTVTTGADGTISTELAEGEYTITEQTDSRYVEPQKKTIRMEKGKTATVTFSNKLKKVTVSVKKVDRDTTTAQGDAVLSGAVYGLYRGETLIQTYTTDETGCFTTEEFPCESNLTLREISPSTGYQLSNESIAIPAGSEHFTKEHNVVTITAEEDVIAGRIQIIKTTDDPDPDWYGTPEEPDECKEDKEDKEEVSSAVEAAEDKPEDTETEENAASSDAEESVAESGSANTVEAITDKKASLPMVERPEVGAIFEIYLTSAGSYADAADHEKDRITTDENGHARTKLLPYGVYTVHQVSGESGKALVEDLTVTISKQEKTYPIPLTDRTLTSQIKIEKRDADTGELIQLAGTAFQIRSKYGQNVLTLGGQTTFVTGESGSLLLPEELPVGEYELIEITAPQGYVLVDEPVSFAVTGEDTTVTISMYDHAQTGKIRIQKLGTVATANSQNSQSTLPSYEQAPLPGAVYDVIADEDITTPDGTLRIKQDTTVDTLTTDENGTAESKALYLGRYRLEERNAPIGMAVNTDPTYLTLTYGDQTLESVTTNAVLTDQRQSFVFTLEKSFFGGNENAYYRLVRFGLYTAENITLEDGSTLTANTLMTELVPEDCNGQYLAEFRGYLPFGRYYVQEIATDPSYLLSNEKYEIDANYRETGETIVELTVNRGEPIVNYKRPPKESIVGAVQLYKKAADTGEALTGATFALYQDTNGNARLDADDTQYGTLTALEDGLYRMVGLSKGGYLLVEETAPQGYQRDEAAYYFEITENNQEITIENEDAGAGFINQPVTPPPDVPEPETGRLVIRKTAEDGVIDGFEMEVKCEETGYCKVFVTPEGGVLEIDGLLPGVYVVTELETERSRRYIIPDPVTVDVIAGETAEAQLYNALPGKNVPKTGDNNRALLYCAGILCGVALLAVVLILKRRSSLFSAAVLHVSLLGLCGVLLVGSAGMLATELNDYQSGQRHYANLAQTVHLGISESRTITSAEPAESEKAAEPTARKAADFSELIAQNEDTVGWLYQEGTGIDYPVMHTDNNEFYLSHLFDKSEHKAGCLFLDCDNSGDFSDAVTVLYGHDLLDGTMLSSLNRYRTQSYYEEHPCFSLSTPQEDYVVQIFSAFEADPDEVSSSSSPWRTGFSDGKELTDWVQTQQARSLIETGTSVPLGSQILVFSTCTGWNDRFLVMGVIKPF